MPPGFAKIPLTSDGRPILGGGSSSLTAPAAAAGPRASTSSTRVSSIQPSAPPPTNNDEVSDDLLAALENEADAFEDDGGGGGDDPELERINRQLNSLLPGIKKAIPKEHLKKMDDHDVDDELMLDDHDDLMLDHGFSQNIEKLIIKEEAKAGRVVVPGGGGGARPSQSAAQVKPQPSSKKPASKELAAILERQRLFKEAALQAKKDGNTNVALVYLRHAKVYSHLSRTIVLKIQLKI